MQPRDILPCFGKSLERNRAFYWFMIQKCTIPWWFETKENYNEDNKQRGWKSAQYFPELVLKTSGAALVVKVERCRYSKIRSSHFKAKFWKKETIYVFLIAFKLLLELDVTLFILFQNHNIGFIAGIVESSQKSCACAMTILVLCSPRPTTMVYL